MIGGFFLYAKNDQNKPTKEAVKLVVSEENLPYRIVRCTKENLTQAVELTIPPNDISTNTILNIATRFAKTGGVQTPVGMWNFHLTCESRLGHYDPHPGLDFGPIAYITPIGGRVLSEYSDYRMINCKAIQVLVYDINSPERFKHLSPVKGQYEINLETNEVKVIPR